MYSPDQAPLSQRKTGFRMKRIIFIMLMSSIGLFSCAQLSNDTHKKLNAAQSLQKQAHYQNNSGQKHWQVGHWSLYKTTTITRDGVFHLFDSKQSKGLVEILIAATEDDMFWLELMIVKDDEEQHIAALISTARRAGDQAQYTVKQLKMHKNGNTQHFTQAELAEIQNNKQMSTVNLWLNFLRHSAHAIAHRNVKVAAGEFFHVKEVPITTALWLGMMSGYLWYHNAVPIFPIVKYDLTSSATRWKHTTETAELVDFGDSGKRNYFSYEQ